MVTLWLVEVMSSPEASDRKVTPAQVAAPAVLMTSTAVPEPPEGGVVSSAGAVPPKGVSVYVDGSASKVTTVAGAGAGEGAGAGAGAGAAAP